jgi:NitT/TauT family transport system ATP-binding protein
MIAHSEPETSTTGVPELLVAGLSKVYDDGRNTTTAIADLGFTVEKGKFVCIVGPSGCGKTTLLKCISGLLPVTTGEILVSGQEVKEPPEQIAVVFQDYSRSLFPWMSVESNVALPLRKKRLSSAERSKLAAEALAAVELTGFSTYYPWQLSGGMQQRVAIARALAYQPEILMMDEPFASVDAQTRADLEDLLLRVRDEYDMTVLFVTHDIDEAVYLADRVIVLKSAPARIQKVLDVDLPHPRDQIVTKEQPLFATLRREVWGLIKQRTVAEPEPGER